MRSIIRSSVPRVAVLAAAVLAAASGAGAQQLVASRLPDDGASVPRASAIDWKGQAPLPAARDHHVTFVTTGSRGAFLHVIGGQGAGQVTADGWRARIGKDGSVGAWEAADRLPAPRAGMAFASDARFAIVAGGKSSATDVARDVYVANLWADGKVGTWRPATFPLPAPRFHNAAVIADGHVYVIGGNDGTVATSTVFRAKLGRDGSIGAWHVLDSLPGARSHQAAFVRDGAIYLVAGLAGDPAGDAKPLGDVLRATIGEDGALGPWQQVGMLDAAFATHAAVVRGDALYVIGGVEDNRTFSDRVIRAPFRADGTLGAWETVNAALPSARAHVHQTPVLGDRIFSVGGSRAGKAIPDVVVGTFADGPR